MLMGYELLGNSDDIIIVLDGDVEDEEYILSRDIS